MSHASTVDFSDIRVMKGGPAAGPSPVDRCKSDSKHLIVEAHSVSDRRHGPDQRDQLGDVE
ncbi:hypothetical protein [Streptomyces siamensis]|uniref:Uncharacterized protein n=1 Tax=Streptomyces siamensis TaxID=1274986 RepID=A0ABP9JAY6_9ACTN